MEPLAPPLQGGDVCPLRGRGEVSFVGRRLHATAPPTAILPVYLECDALVELGMAEWVFYLRNDGGLLPAYSGKMVTESPQKWVWGALAEEQKRLAPLLARLKKLRDARVTAATVATAFHKRSLLPLA